MRVLAVRFIVLVAILVTRPALGQGTITDLYQQAVEAHDSGDFEKAIELYSGVIDRDSMHANAYWNRANLWPDESNSKALADYRKVTELAPNFDAAFGNYGFTLLLEKRLMEARQASQKALNLDNAVYSWPLNIGHTYLLEGKADSARTFYQWALHRMESREDLESALGDFDIFIERNWEAENSRSMQKWMHKSYNGRD